jgi:hypothetical protein
MSRVSERQSVEQPRPCDLQFRHKFQGGNKKMKRRNFGLLSAASMAAAGFQKAEAQAAPDATLLTTTFTPMGGERAGNADGSIPAWTGGAIAPPGTPTEVKMFTDEAPLFTVDASNMAQYQAMLNPGVQTLMKEYGFSIRVFPTHRTANAPQYVYDNTAKNVTRAVFDPVGGRFGFTGAFGGVPFPIIDTSDVLVGGAQLIWNHLCAWGGYSYGSPMSQSFVVSSGQLVLSEGNTNQFVCPYFDPNGNPESFDGYLQKIHLRFNAPANFNGQEVLTWHTTNVRVQPDITWEVLNGQGRVRKAPDLAYDAPNPYSNAVSNEDESAGFYGNPSLYDWRYIAKVEMLVPYNCSTIRFHTADEVFLPKFPNPEIIRWEKHRVWVVEATLHPGERNVLARRRYYIDEDSWYILLGESYDGGGNMVKTNFQYPRAIPVLPGVIPNGATVFNVQTGDYTYGGTVSQPPYTQNIAYMDISPSVFYPQEMAANASF